MGVSPPSLTDSDLDALASDFLESHYLGSIYADWAPDRRLDTFLRRRGLARVANDGDLSHNVLERIMTRAAVPRWRGIDRPALPQQNQVGNRDDQNP